MHSAHSACAECALYMLSYRGLRRGQRGLVFRAVPEGGSSSGGEKRKLNQEGLSGGSHWMFCSVNVKRG